MQDDFTALEATLEKLTPRSMSEESQRATLALNETPLEFPLPEETLTNEKIRSYPWMRMAAATLVLSAGLAAWLHSERSPNGQPSASTLPSNDTLAGVPDARSEVPLGMRETPDDLILLAPPKPDIGFYEPVSFESVIINQLDEGILEYDDALPMRQIRQQTLNHSQWVNPITGDRFITTEPDEEVILFNVNTN